MKLWAIQMWSIKLYMYNQQTVTSTCNPPGTLTRRGLSVQICAILGSASLVISTPQPWKCKHKHMGTTWQLPNLPAQCFRQYYHLNVHVLHGMSCQFMNPKPTVKQNIAPTVKQTT